jgi:hypothetical protein
MSFVSLAHARWALGSCVYLTLPPWSTPKSRGGKNPGRSQLDIVVVNTHPKFTHSFGLYLLFIFSRRKDSPIRNVSLNQRKGQPPAVYFN